MTNITHLSQLDRNGMYTYADYLTWKFDEMVELVRGKIMPISPVIYINEDILVSSVFPDLQLNLLDIFAAA